MKGFSCIVLMLMAIVSDLSAQQGFVSIGNSQSSETASFTYSVGLVANKQVSGNQTTYTAGLQHPFEFFEFCLYDLNADLSVDTEDLLIVLAELGCFNTCISDLNEDAVVNILDLLLFLTRFGSHC